MFSLIWKAILGGNPMSWIVLALGSVILLGSSFGLGYYEGTSNALKINAEQLASAASKAASKQADIDAKDWALAKADYDKRLAAKGKGEVKYQVLYRDRKVLVPNPAKASVPADAMKQLNDPALVGETQ